MTDTIADIDSIRRFVQAAGWRRIGIDGVDGAGKLFLAEYLSRSLTCPTLDVDDYVYKNQGGYVDFVDYPALSSALSSIPAFVLCGVCLREILSNLGTTLDGYIYIKRMRHGLWMDEDECVFPDGVDVAIESRARSSAMRSSYFDERSQQVSQQDDDSSPQLSDEVMRYHDNYLPHEVADLVFERTDETG